MKRTQAEERRYQDGMTILRTVANETSVVSKELKTTNAANVPDRAAHRLDTYIKSIDKHEVYGSLAMKSRTFAARKPNDVDIVVMQPKKVAGDIAHVMRRAGSKVRIESNPQFNSHVVQVKKKNEWVDAVDIHPLQEHRVKFDVHGRSLPPHNIKGVKVQRAADQLLRKANSVMAHNPTDNRMGAAEHRRYKDTIDFVTTSRLLLDSKQLRAEAELEQVKKGRKALGSWKKHARSLKGAPKGKLVRDPIPEYREQQFISYARDNPNINVDMITLNKEGALGAPSVKRGRSYGSCKMYSFGKGGY